MKIRNANNNDIPQLVVIDGNAYGNYGADEKYFKKKLTSPNTKILVVINQGKITGFAVFEILKKDEIPSDFTDLSVNKPINDSWVHIVVFTTETNYLEVNSDIKLVSAIERMAKSLGQSIFCVPLSINHPFIKHDVFGFWEKNGYENVGTIKWIVSPEEKIDCYFYKKVIEG